MGANRIVLAILLPILTSLVHIEAVSMSTKTEIKFVNASNIVADAKFQPFQKLGHKYYYIEQKLKLNWFQAAEKCRELGGNLVQFQNKDEMYEITWALKSSNENYWLDINDLGEEGNYVSIATGKEPTYTAWSPENVNDDSKDCAHLWFSYKNRFTMKMGSCTMAKHFVCELPATRTVSIVVW